MREAAAVTTPMCWSFKRWTMRDVHSPDEDWDEMRMSMISPENLDDEDEHDGDDGNEHICSACGQYMTTIIYTKIVPSDIHLLLEY